MKIGIILIIFGIILLIISYFTAQWSYDFVDPCCSGLCGQCPPSFWECSFMSMVSVYQIIIGIIIIGIGLFDLLGFINKK